MSDDQDYRLSPIHFPKFPTVPSWVDQLRWCIAVMDPGAKDLGTTASILSFVLKHDFITKRQARIAQVIIDQLRASYVEGDLVFQSLDIPPKPKSDTLSETLETMIPRGRA